jgi:hypothetical protein
MTLYYSLVCPLALNGIYYSYESCEEDTENG